jgi:hypothetical protein
MAYALILNAAHSTFRRMMKRLSLLILAFFLVTCDHGLAPPPSVEPGFGGTIYFEKGTWPSPDSLNTLWLFASQVYPLDSSKVVSGLLSDPPTIYLYPASDRSLPFNVDSVSYTFNLPLATYKYIGVIQRFANDLNVHSLRVVGLYGTSDSPPVPIPVIVSEGTFTPDVTFKVNFRKPPPQPF